MEANKLSKLKESGLSIRQIESKLSMPKNSLSGMMSGSKKIPLKWDILLSEFVDNLSNNKNESEEMVVDDKNLKDILIDEMVLIPKEPLIIVKSENLKKGYNMPEIPIKGKDENSIDFAARKNEWKLKCIKAII